VSNASTDGYTRKILPQEAQTINGVTIGVSTDEITRNVDLNLEKDFWIQQSSVSFLSTQAAYLNQIQQFNGPPDSESSIAAKISGLRDSFASLSDDPGNTALQGSVVSAAQNVASKFNDFGNLINKMRNDTQADMAATVADINSKLQQIATANAQIKFNTASGKTTAALEDTRDSLIKNLSQDMNLSSFTRADGVMVVQTAQGVQLADETAQTVTFKPAQLSATSSYPASAAGIFVGDPAVVQQGAINITNNAGGKLGALVDLRDNTLPQQQASLDEMAEQLAQRFDQQGLRLFTDPSGNIPANTAPNPATSPPTPVPYVGFASTIQVNNAVVQNNTLVQQGTVPTDIPVQSGSSEVIRRITDFTFGSTDYQQANGTVNLNAPPGTDLQTWLGLYSSNRITGSAALSNSSSATALMASAPATFNPATPGTSDQFTLTFSELRGGAPPPPGSMTVTISLSQAQADFPGGSNAADQIASEINKQVTTAVAGTPAFAGLAAKASVNSYGQLVLQSRGDINVDASGVGGMGQAGLTYLGLTAGTQTTTDPYINVQVGADPPVQISIIPGEDQNGLVASLQGTNISGVPGLGVSLSAGGLLTVQPGDSTVNPTFGGDLKITGGPFTTAGPGPSPGGMAAGTPIIAALFGSDTPVASVPYSSANAIGPATAFRTSNLGPGANISTGITSNGSLIDYSQQVINVQAQQVNDTQTQLTDETTYSNTLQKSLQDSSGVNVDQELSNMIVAQTAYSAAARVISALEQQFKDLLAAF
jgi:flagellar hook-associated protein 1 FlgK